MTLITGLSFILVNLLGLQVSAASFYVSSSLGSPDGNGTQPKFASSDLSRILLKAPAGSRINLCEGDVFLGPYVSQKNHIIFSSYICDGSRKRAQPVITSSRPLSSPQIIQSSNGQTMWVYDTSKVVASDQLVGNVWVNGQQYVVARFPNLKDPKVRYGQSREEFEFMTNKSLTGFIMSDKTLAKGTDYWIGGTVRYRLTNWNSDRRLITGYMPENKSHTLDRNTYFGKYYVQQLFGYYIENIFGELDAPGEYFYDRKAKKLFLIPLAGSNSSQSSDMDTNIGTWVLPTSNFSTPRSLLDGYEDVCLKVNGNATRLFNVAIKKCMNGLYVAAKDAVIVSTTVSSSADTCIRLTEPGNATDYLIKNQPGIIRKSFVSDCGIFGIYGGSDISYISVSDIGLTAGMSWPPSTRHLPAGVLCGNCVLRNSLIQRTGYAAIYPSDHSIVKDNVVDQTMMAYADGGAIYSFLKTNVTVIGNYIGKVVSNQISVYKYGENGTEEAATGLYADYGGRNWTIMSNLFRPLNANWTGCFLVVDSKFDIIANNTCVGGGGWTTRIGSNRSRVDKDYLTLENNTFVPEKGVIGRKFQWKMFHIPETGTSSFKGNTFILNTSYASEKIFYRINSTIKLLIGPNTTNTIDTSGIYKDQNELDRQFDCARLTISYNFQAYPSWKSPSCISQFCNFIKSRMTELPQFPVYQSIYTRECNYDATQCGRVSEKYGFIPFVTAGKTPPHILNLWHRSDCDHKMCSYWPQKYRVGVSAMPQNIQKSWKRANCTSI